jgi:hypothetical protein
MGTGWGGGAGGLLAYLLSIGKSHLHFLQFSTTAEVGITSQAKKGPKPSENQNDNLVVCVPNSEALISPTGSCKNT